MHPRSILLMTLGPALLLGPSARAGTFYTGKSGCSAAGPGSASQPFCTVSQGVKALKAGDTLLVQTGTYKEQVIVDRSGAAGQPIVIAAAPGAAPVIDASDEQFDEEGIITISNRSFITLRGLTVKSSPYYCIHVSTSKNIIVEKVKVDGCYHGGIVFDQGSSAVKAIGNDVKATDQCGQGCGTHEAITFSETTNFEASGNTVHNGIKEGIDAKDGSKDGLIHDNVVANMGQVGIYLNHCTNVKVYRNKVHHTGSSAFQIAVGDLAMNAKITDNNELYQNEAWGNAYCGIELWAEGSGTMANNKIYNNVLHDNGHYGIQLSDESSQAYGNIVRNNIISNNKLGGIEGSAISANTISHNLFYQTGATAGTNQVSGDPLFSAAASGDFTLKAGSPAIDKGFEMGLPKVGAPDIGAHEYGYTPPKPDSGVVPPPKLDSGVVPPPKQDSAVSPAPDSGVAPPPPGPNLDGSGCSLGAATTEDLLLCLTLLLAAVLLLRRRRVTSSARRARRGARRGARRDQ